MSQAHKLIQHHRYKSELWETANTEAVVEAPVSLTVNGRAWLTFMCTPVELEALAVGFLFNEGVVDSVAEVASVRVCPTRVNVDIWLRREVPRPDRWARPSGCTGGAMLVSSHSRLPLLVDGVRLPAVAIGHLMAQLSESQQLYRNVGGVHASALSDGQDLFALAEDIGRHNTLDKLAGRCLLDRVVMNESVLLTTGRISSDMLWKAARMGTPVVISRSAPTSLAIELAEQCGITLIGYACRDSFKVYTHPERVNPGPLHTASATAKGCEPIVDPALNYASFSTALSGSVL